MLIALVLGWWCSLVRAFCWQWGRQNLTAIVRVCHRCEIEEIPHHVGDSPFQREIFSCVACPVAGVPCWEKRCVMMSSDPKREAMPDLFVLRWGEEEEWGHLAAVASQRRKPVLVGFVRLDDDPVFRKLTRNSVPGRNGMREVWFSGSVLEREV
jgi:hypothetical protein